MLRVGAKRREAEPQGVSPVKMHESELTEFFGVLPTPEPAEEREYFQAPHFEKTVGDLQLVFSMSQTYNDAMVTLRLRDAKEDCLSYRLQSVQSAKVEIDANGREWLVVVSDSGSLLRPSVNSTIQVKIHPGMG